MFKYKQHKSGTLVSTISQKQFKMYKCMELIFDCLNTVLTLGSKLVWISVWTPQLELCILSLKPFLHIQVWTIHKRTFVMFLLSCFQKSIRYWNFRIAWGWLTCVIFFAFWSPWLFFSCPVARLWGRFN